MDKENDKFSNLKNQFFLSEETQKSLKKLIPKISHHEVMSCESKESKAADKMLLSLGKNIAKFLNQEELNRAMNILFYIGMKRSAEGYLSKYKIFEDFCKDFESLSWEEFDKILSKLIGKSILNPLNENNEILHLTSMGKFLVHNYQKLKLETIAMRRYGIFEDLFVMVEMIRSFINFEQYGQELNWIYGLVNALKDLSENLKRQGNAILENPEFDVYIKEIHKLMDQILEIQKQDNSDESGITMQHHVHICMNLLDTIIQLIYLASTKYDLRLAKSKNILLEKPFIKMEDFIINSLDDIDWQKLFFSCKTCAIPVKFPMKINAYYIKTALINVLRKVTDPEFEELPEPPSSILKEKPFIESVVKKSDLIPLKKTLLKKAIKLHPADDYRVVRSKNPRIFLENLLMFYTLSLEKKILLETDFRLIEDSERYISKFTARKYNLMNNKLIEE